MKSLHKTWVLAILLGIGGGASILSAQPDGKATPDEKAASPESSLKRLSIPEMTSESKKLAEKVRSDLLHVRYLQGVARKQQDLIRLTCVNDLMLQIKAQANVFDDARRNLENALGTDADQRFSLFDETSRQAEGVHKIRVEADACIGEDQLGTESLTQVNDPGLDDPTLGDPFKPDIEPPAYATPFN